MRKEETLKMNMNECINKVDYRGLFKRTVFFFLSSLLQNDILMREYFCLSKCSKSFCHSFGVEFCTIRMKIRSARKVKFNQREQKKNRWYIESSASQKETMTMLHCKLWYFKDLIWVKISHWLVWMKVQWGGKDHDSLLNCHSLFCWLAENIFQAKHLVFGAYYAFDDVYL